MPKIEFDQYGLLKASINSFGLNTLLLASGIFAFDLFHAKEFQKKIKNSVKGAGWFRALYGTSWKIL